jgi:thiosulfate/3-mercaptopyruvate sulfurtransferase
VAGHIPGAVNIPYLNNLEANGSFRSPEALADQYRSIIGGPTADRVIVHCGSGVTACHTLLALEVAGIHGARLYSGSWSEWSRNQKPVSRGKNP